MDREQQILALIRQNPFISQNEIAGSIGISRSAVAGYIASLTRKGVVRGRAYILADEASILCIGGANLDSKASGKQPIRLASSNPVTVTESCGGVARNIAENLARLSCPVSLMSIVGNDKAGEWVLDETRKQGVDTGLVYIRSGERTGAYTTLIDISGEMVLAFANMDIYDRLTPAMMMDKWPHIAASTIVIADTNLSADCLQELAARCREESLTLLVDPVSSQKAKKLPPRLDGVTAIFPNVEEACEIAGLPITDEPEYAALALAIRERGVRNVFITLGKKGVYYNGEDGELHLPPIPTDIVEVTGAGDAFVAGAAYALLHERSYAQACRLGLAASHIALQTSLSVSEHLTEGLLHETLQKLG